MRAQSSVINHRLRIAKAFTLVEMLVAITLAPILMVAVNGFFRSFIRDVPQVIRLVQQNTTVLNMLDQLRRDMDEAVGLPEQSGDKRADSSTLLIQQADALICYRFEDGRAVRTPLEGQGVSPSAKERVWQARDAVVEWKPWTPGGKTRGVEVHSYLKQRVDGELKRRFFSSHVFFVHGFAEGGPTQ